MRSERAFVWLNRLAAHAQAAVPLLDPLIGGLPLTFATLERMEAVNRDDYDRSRLFDSDAHRHLGLFPFERERIAQFFPKPPARLLAHGAGGGRQSVALLERGYAVDAFEPVPRLAAAAEAFARERGHAAASVTCRTIQAWAGNPPVARYDGVVLGWSTYGHLLAAADRVAALRAFRVACPEGPVLLSFRRALEEEETSAGGHLATAIRLVRTRVLRLPPLEPGTAWSGWDSGAFFHEVTLAELGAEAAAGGYTVAHFEHSPETYPHAVLLPR